VTRPVKVVVAARLFTPEVAAGAFRLQALANALLQRGANVDVVTTTPPENAGPSPSTERRQSRDGLGGELRVSRLPAFRDAGGNVRGYLQYLSFDLPLFLRLLGRRADVFVSEPPPTTGLVVRLVATIKRRPYVYYAADIWTDALNALSVPGFVKVGMRLVEGFVFRGAAGIVAVSEEVAERLTAFGVDPRRVTVANNGVNTDTFTPHGPAEIRPGPVFVYTGTMSEWQGAVVFIEAMTRINVIHPDAQLHFFGQGSDEGALRAAARTLGLSTVHFDGIVPPHSAAAWLRGATAALASIRPDQGYDFAKPTKIYAAAACGTPVVFAGSGAGAEVVTVNGLGWAVDYAVEAVVDAMSAAIAEQADGTSRRLQGVRATWAVENASLLTTGKRAADAVLAVRRR